MKNYTLGKITTLYIVCCVYAAVIASGITAVAKLVHRPEKINVIRGAVQWHEIVGAAMPSVLLLAALIVIYIMARKKQSFIPMLHAFTLFFATIFLLYTFSTRGLTVGEYIAIPIAVPLLYVWATRGRQQPICYTPRKTAYILLAVLLVTLSIHATLQALDAAMSGWFYLFMSMGITSLSLLLVVLFQVVLYTIFKQSAHILTIGALFIAGYLLHVATAPYLQYVIGDTALILPILTVLAGGVVAAYLSYARQNSTA